VKETFESNEGETHVTFTRVHRSIRNFSEGYQIFFNNVFKVSVQQSFIILRHC